jgi:WD40 repeat protein
VFATGGGNNGHAVVLWKTATGKRIDPFPGHTSPIAYVAFSPDGKTAATCSWIRGDPVIRLWDPQSGRLLPRTFEMPGWGGVSAIAFSPDGRTLAACSWYGGKKVGVWDVATGRERHMLAGHEAGCTCLAFSPDGKRLATGDAYYNRDGQYEGRLCIWDADSGKRLREVRGTRGAIQRVRFTPDGRHVLAAADGVHVYDADTGKLVGEPIQAKSRIWGLALSPDGRLLATADEHSVRLWELATRREFRLTVPNGNCCDVDFTPDGRILMAPGSREVVLVHLPSEKIVGKVTGDAGSVTRAFLSPDGRRLATARNAESSALIWDVADLVKQPLPAVGKPDGADLRRWWAELRDDRPGVAYQAVWRFAAAREQGLPFLADVLRPVKAAEPAAVARLIADLDSDEFAVRERASEELGRLGEAVADTLRKAREGKVSAEQARRIDRLLEEFAGLEFGPEQWRATRAVAALEQIGGPEAGKVLAGLAGGAAGARLTREAKAALERLKRLKRTGR